MEEITATTCTHMHRHTPVSGQSQTPPPKPAADHLQEVTDIEQPDLIHPHVLFMMTFPPPPPPPSPTHTSTRLSRHGLLPPVAPRRLMQVLSMPLLLVF